MNRINIKQHLHRALSALIVVGALFTLPRTQAEPPTSVHGYSNDCESLISEQHHDGNTIFVLSISATFTGTFDGTWLGTERDVIHPDGSVNLHGSGVFTGSVFGRSGTMVFSYHVKVSPDGTEVTHWVVNQGTGDLASIRGSGTTPSDEENGPTDECPWDTFTVEYEGQVQFGP